MSIVIKSLLIFFMYCGIIFAVHDFIPEDYQFYVGYVGGIIGAYMSLFIISYSSKK